MIVEGEEAGLQDHWYLVDTHGQKFRLPKTMLFLGREECDVVVASQSVDKRHAVLTFDLYLNRFKVKDLSTTNGTYVNNSRIPEEEYVTLNHMDSIRLGQDAMMYHIEQGSQITTLGGQLPDPHYIPSWASRAQDSATIHVHAHSLAECQGCIAEQKIDHTCTLKLERRPSDGDSQVTDSRHLAHHLSEQHHHHQQGRSRDHQQPVQLASKLAQQSNGGHQGHNYLLSDQPPNQQHISRDASNQQHVCVDDQTSVTDDSSDRRPDVPDQCLDAPTVGRNTWPKKRQVRKTAHVGSVFYAEASDNPATCDNPDNLVASETNPAGVASDAHLSNMTSESTAVSLASEIQSASVASEAHPAGAVQTMFFVTFDDALCNADDPSAGDKDRRSRNARNPAPSELATVKKGTPLYGQPSWWGEVEGDATTCGISRSDGDNKNNCKNSRPTNLGLIGSEVSVAKKPGTVYKAGITESGHVKQYSNPTYMEIPIKDGDSPVRADKFKDVSTPAKSLSSSLSKDSLSVSPELKQPPNKNAKTQSPTADVNASMSFTVDLDDPEHPPKKSLNIGSSISEFVPSKIRKNFRERKSVSSKTSSKESTPSKNSEEHDLSPLSQRKIDEVWSTAVEGKGKSWLSSMQANAGSSLRSPNLEEIDRLSEFSDERRSLDRESERKGSLKRPVSSKSPQISSKAVPPSSMGPCSRSPAGVSVNQYADSTSYLIDRMFEGGSSGPSLTDKRESPEQKLYREAANYDKNIDSRRSTDKALDRPIIDSKSSPPIATKNVRKTTLTKAVQPHVIHDGEADDDDLRITEDIVVSDDGVDEKEDKEDKASEAGTYTIEADIKERQEEEEARKRIDQVFGVDVESFNTDQPIIDPLRLASPGGYDNVYDFDDDDGDSDRTPLDESCQSPVDADTDLTADDDYDGESNDMAATEGVQMWMTQLTALTNHKSPDTNRTVIEDGEASLSKKPPQGISRKRPGTGRKLPSIPSDKSPVSSEHGSHSADVDFVTGDEVFTGRAPNHAANGRNSADSNGKPRSNSSQSRSRTTSNGHPASPSTSTRSRGSVDTEVLLQDTETAMAAMQARISHKSGQCRKDSYSQDSDTDASSTVALVNGDENYVKSRQYKSPREALAHRQKNDIPAKPSIKSSSVPVKKPLVPLYSQTVATKSMPSPRSTPSNSGTRKSIVSDVVSRRDSMDNDSIISDVSSEAGEGHHSRSSSKGKGTITMTRTNKTFDLRRARVDSFEEPATPKSVKSSASSKSNTSSSYGRSQSLHSTTRNRSLATTSRSDVTSLGAQIVRKSQSNINEEKARKTGKVAVSRTDSGGDKHSQGQRFQHSNSLATSRPSVASNSSKKESTPKSQQRLTPINKAGLVITGISSVSSRSQSQPGSRSNSPKSAEKMAWKRRKEYDARKSVAEAKAGKTKDGGTSGVTMRPKPSASSSIRRRMIRSASFTNSAGLSLGIHNSVSSSQDLSDRRDSFNQHEEFRRAFIPFHSSLRNDRSTHSADEDDSLVSANSTQDVTRSLISLLKTPSAFTPPPQRNNKPVSPEMSPPSKAYLSLRRRTLNIGESSAQLQANGHFEGIRQSQTQSSYQTSYDSLIVASIYQLSLKLKTATDKTLSKLRDQNRVSHTPSPIDDFLSDTSKSELPAWKTANQELAGTLKNLRKLERHVHMMNTVIFPDADVNSEVSSHVPASRQVKQRLLEDIERKFGFQPIDHPHPFEADNASPEMAEFSGQF